MSTRICPDDFFLGTVTVGDRGQVVIPAEARKKLNINTGDKFFVVSHPSGEGLLMFKVQAMRDFLSRLTAGLSNEDELAQSESEEGIPDED